VIICCYRYGISFRCLLLLYRVSAIALLPLHLLAHQLLLLLLRLIWLRLPSSCLLHLLRLHRLLLLHPLLLLLRLIWLRLLR
jgi:hypothetical protein